MPATVIACPYGCTWTIDAALDPDGEALAAHREAHQALGDNGTQPEPQETPIATCKLDGCQRPRLSVKGGPYAALCLQHKQERQAARAAAKAGDPPPAAAPETGLEPPANGTLAELGRQVDERLARIRTLTLELTTERDLLADDANTFQLRVRQATDVE